MDAILVTIMLVSSLINLPIYKAVPCLLHLLLLQKTRNFRNFPVVCTKLKKLWCKVLPGSRKARNTCCYITKLEPEFAFKVIHESLADYVFEPLIVGLVAKNPVIELFEHK